MKQRLLSLVTAPRVLYVLALALVAGAAHAGVGPPLPLPTPPPMPAPTIPSAMQLAAPGMIRRSAERHNQRLRQSQPPAHGSVPSLRAQTLPRASASLYTGEEFATRKGIYQLVAPYPAQDQTQIAKVFITLIRTFDKTTPQTYGIPANNLATAYTAVVAGSYAAYTNQPFPENAVKPLFQQVEQVILNDPKILQASMDDKGTQYQVWVGMGMLLLGWQNQLAQHPNPQQQAQMQKAGADALHALGIDPDKVSFTASGMELR